MSCGSESLTPTQQRHATIELECLAVYFVIDKCSYYLKGGTYFTVATDHKPLEGNFAKDLYDIPNPRLQRLSEKLVEYNFTVKWVSGEPSYRRCSVLSSIVQPGRNRRHACRLC